MVVVVGGFAFSVGSKGFDDDTYSALLNGLEMSPLMMMLC